MNDSLRLTFITLLLAVSNLSAATLYVSLGSTNPTPPYTNWATAATTIQQAVWAAAAGDVVVVTNGVYAGGVAVTNLLTLRSANGPQVTAIDGGGTKRCVSLTNGASLSGFTLTNGWAADYGGGVWCTSTNVFLTNCTLTGNSATMGGGAAGAAFAYYCALYNCTLANNSTFLCGAPVCNGGGGAYWCKLYNCTLTGNSSRTSGGGADWCELYNCTLTGNWAGSGGGAGNSGLNNCTLTGNSAGLYGGGASWSGLYNCTLTGNGAGGAGGAYNCTLNNCISFGNYHQNDCEDCGSPGRLVNSAWFGDPLFVVTNGWANLRLQSNSPCINAGNNAYVTTPTDLDGRPRIVGGTVDMGAYEFQPGVNGAFIGWLQGYGLPTDGSADFADTDADGMNNWQEWVCGTDPTNRLSALRLLSAAPAGTNVTVTWQSVAGVNYFLQRSANLASPFALLATNILGQAGTTSYADTNATGAGPFFYRVGVKPP
jgi:hypothetical protein